MMLMNALQAEVDEYLESARCERGEVGRTLVVRNGRARERKVLLGDGVVELKAPRADDRRVDENGNRRKFKSVILPPSMRRSPKVREVMPPAGSLRLRGRADTSALEEFFGTLTFTIVIRPDIFFFLRMT